MNAEQYQKLLTDIRHIIRQELAMRDNPAPPEIPAAELMTIKDVANALVCSLPHARKMVYQGEIPSVLIAKKRYVTVAAFKALYA